MQAPSEYDDLDPFWELTTGGIDPSSLLVDELDFAELDRQAQYQWFSDLAYFANQQEPSLSLPVPQLSEPLSELQAAPRQDADTPPGAGTTPPPSNSLPTRGSARQPIHLSSSPSVEAADRVNDAGDLFDDNSSFIDGLESSFDDSGLPARQTPEMPARPTGKRQRPMRKRSESLSSEDLFGDVQAKKPRRGKTPGDDEEITTVDLTEATEVPPELLSPIEDNGIKILKFQCVICMDDASNLTVTACGHLFCAECLHNALHAETTKGKCPMCRAKIDMRPRENYARSTKGVYPVEIQLTKGKGKARQARD